MRLVLALSLALAAVAGGVSTSHAQAPAFAIGKPLEDGGLPAGTVSVRVIAGNPSSPVVGTEVTLIVGGTPRVARTNAEGRAVFAGLTAGTPVQAKIKNAEDKEVTSETFPVPSSGGMRVMLTTKPFGAGGAGGGPAMGGGGPAAGGGMPGAKQMSGQPQVTKDVPAATYVVRLTYDNLSLVAGQMADDKPPVGEKVTLVGYAADDSVTVETQPVDASGLATFRDLDMSGGTGYFALAALPRGTGVDRVFALPAQLDGSGGVRVVLSGEKRDSTAPNMDALKTQYALSTPPGMVRVTLEGVPSPNTPVRLFDAATKQVIAQGTANVLAADPTTVEASSSFTAKPDLPGGAVEVYVHGGDKADAPLPDVEIRIAPVGAAAEAPVHKTGTDGKLKITVPGTAGTKYTATYKIQGRELTSEPFELAPKGGALDIKASWVQDPRQQVLFDVPYKAGQVLYAEATSSGRLTGTFRSMPFMPIAQAGTHVGVIIYPRVLLRFNMRAMVEDELLAVQGRWTLENNSWIPYRSTMDGLLIPFPKGHKGGVVADMNQNDVAVVPGEGVRVMRPLPPGSGVSFVAGFTMPADGGTVDWALDLPLGTFGSDFHVRQTPGLSVELPPGAKGEVKAGRDGNPYFMVEQITIGPGRSMTMKINGLPSPPSWKLWAPRVIGVAVILLMIGGLVFALATKGNASSSTSARRAQLLDELVQLERSGANPKRKEQVMAELEKLWAP